MSLELLKEVLENDPFLKHVGIKVKSISVGSCELYMDYKQELTRFGGSVNGGAIATIADAAGGCAALTSNLGYNEVTVDLEVTYLRPVTEGPIKAVSKILKSGKNLAYVLIEVYDGKENLCSIVKGTYFYTGRF
ncbi:MAG: PaaI family thioesterase [Nitrososphaeria archaeon]|nr:PaaI family thioesterase [Conexivisphaerales archaeon]